MIPTSNETDNEPGGDASSRAAAWSARGQRRMVGFEQRCCANVRPRPVCGRGDRIVVGFSGGRDSLALAAALRRVSEATGIEPVLVHVDHRLRPSSAAEAEQVVALAECAGAGVPAWRPLTSPPRDVHPGVGLEEAARRERYRILLRLGG